MSRRTISLAGVFVIVTGCALLLTAGRVFGYVAVGALMAAPWPVIFYVHFVRQLMIRAQADFQTRSLMVNLICAAGLVLALFVTTTLLGVGITYLKHKPSFLDPHVYLYGPN
jgi:hypothetical protein